MHLAIFDDAFYEKFHKFLDDHKETNWFANLDGNYAKAHGEKVDAKQLDEAEALLLELRARDARRADLPPELRRGFAHLFEARADEDKDDAGPCDALAALAADAEDWEAVYDACRQAMARGGATDRRRALALRARRSTWRGLEEVAALPDPVGREIDRFTRDRVG